MTDSINYSSQAGAYELADRITRYWAAHGITVKCRVEPVAHRGSTTDGGRLFGVRSDLGMYVPRGAI